MFFFNFPILAKLSKHILAYRNYKKPQNALHYIHFIWKYKQVYYTIVFLSFFCLVIYILLILNIERKTQVSCLLPWVRVTWLFKQSEHLPVTILPPLPIGGPAVTCSSQSVAASHEPPKKACTYTLYKYTCRVLHMFAYQLLCDVCMSLQMYNHERPPMWTPCAISPVCT